KRDIPFIAETWKDIAYAQNIDKKDFQTFLNHSRCDWTALPTKDGGLSFFKHEDETVYHRYIDPDGLTGIKSSASLPENPMESLYEEEKQSVFNGKPVLFIDENYSCKIAASDGNEIHLVNLDEEISGFSYKMQSSEPIHIPEPHT